MRTVLPSVTPALWHAWIPTDRGSIRAPSSNVTLSGNLVHSKLAIKGRKSRRTEAGVKMLHKSLQRSDSCWATCGSMVRTDKLLLVAEVGIVFVVSAKVSIIRGCGTEEDGRREVVFPSFEVFVHLTWDTRLDGHSISLEMSLSTAVNHMSEYYSRCQNFIFFKLV